MNDLSGLRRSRDQRRGGLDTLLEFHELWVIERMPEGRRDAVFWNDERIPYNDRKKELEHQRQYFVSPSPYPGLRSFTPQEARVFFGRRSDVEAVRQRLKTNRMVMVLGGSGSGKSSLVRAGVLPHLNGVGRIAGRGGAWYWCEFRPEQSPIRNFIDALAKHVVVPLVDAIRDLAVHEPGVGEKLVELGLDLTTSPEAAREWLAAPFEAAESSEALFNALSHFVDTRLDRLDLLAAGGIRAGKPNILILLDQFEEIFREGPSQRQRRETAQLLGLLDQMNARLRGEPKVDEGGLYMTLTMRSEELHRCGEHEGLTELVNRSVFLLELLDPRRVADREVLRRAIVEPARKVFLSYGIPFNPDQRDSPFAKGLPDELIDGAAQLSKLEHRPDQLPLLQHALRSMWDEAMQRWAAVGQTRSGPRILRKDFRGDDLSTKHPDLDLCLDDRADKAAAEARGLFRNPGSEQTIRLSAEESPEGELALRAAFTALSYLGERVRARRFASADEIVEFLENNTQMRAWRPLKPRVERALERLVFHGYLTGGGKRPYDISHEALIRNWKRSIGWLNQAEGVVRALRRFLDEVDPREFDKLQSDADRAREVPETLTRLIGTIGRNRAVPASWALEQLTPLLTLNRRRRWTGNEKLTAAVARGEATRVLARIRRIAKRSGDAHLELRVQAQYEKEQAEQAEKLRQEAEKATAAARTAKFRFYIAASFAGAATATTALAVVALMNANTSSLSGNRVSAATQIDTLGAQDWSEATKLGVLEWMVPPAPPFWTFGRVRKQTDVEAVRWDMLARSVVGGSLWLRRGEGPTAAAERAPLACLTKSGKGSWGSNAPTEIFQVSERQGSVTLSGKAVGSDVTLSGQQLPPLGPETQLCVGGGASVLTVAQRDQAIPNFFELSRLNCTATCSGVVTPIRVNYSPLRRDGDSRPPPDETALKSVQLPQESGDATVTQISTGHPDDRVDIHFETQWQKAETGRIPYVASYYRGWLTPQRVAVAPPTGACIRVKDAWSCEGRGRRRQNQFEVRIERSSPDSFTRMTVTRKETRYASTALRFSTVPVPTGSMPIGVTDRGLLILRDRVGDIWGVKISGWRLRDLVTRFGDSSYLPETVREVAPLIKMPPPPPRRHGPNNRVGNE